MWVKPNRVGWFPRADSGFADSICDHPPVICTRDYNIVADTRQMKCTIYTF